MYFFTRSSVLSLPCCSSSRIDAAVNCFVIEPSRNFDSAVFGTCHSTLAKP